LEITESELLKIKGIGKRKAGQILAVLEIARLNPLAQKESPRISTPRDVYDLMYDLQFLDREHFLVLGLDIKNHVILKNTVSVGNLNSSMAHPREIFKMLIKNSCASVILVHNHPSGDSSPSKEDICLTKKLVGAGELLSIKILDHIIIGHGSFFSMKEKSFF